MLDEPTPLLRVLAGCAGALLPLINRPGRPPIPQNAEGALASETRRRIYDLVLQRPGIQAGEAKRLLELGGGSVHHHAAKLEAAGLIERREISGSTHLYPNGAAPSAEDAPLERPAVRRVAEVIARRGEASAREIADELGLVPRAVTNHLRELAAAGLIRTHARGSTIVYSLTRELKPR